MLEKTDFTFRSSDRVGFADAEQDQVFLAECFVDNGQYKDLIDGDTNCHIILGRTGAGKTALLERISEQQHNVIQLSPDLLAFNYLTNNTVLRFLLDLDLELDLFFGLLWRHIIVVEVIRRRYKIQDDSAKQRFFSMVPSLFQSTKQQKALAYLEKWGNSFWLSADERVREIATKIEADVKATAGVDFPGLVTKLESGAKFSTEEKKEYKERFQHIISSVQLQELANVIDLLDSLLDDKQQVYFVLVDHLDEKWVDGRFKTRLIRSLLEAARKFVRVRNLRVVIALRYDLYDRVLEETRVTEQQEDKLHSSATNIRWSREDLTRLLDMRINRLIRQRYTKRSVTHNDILPNHVKDNKDQKITIDWIMDRTFKRPRDIIQFFNFAMAQSISEPAISEQALLRAEGEYSRERMNAIADEYIVTYPTLLNFVEVLYGKPEKFALSDIEDLELREKVVTALGTCNGTTDRLREWAHAFEEGSKTLDEFKRDLFFVFYYVGIVGMQKAPGEEFSWTYESRRTLSRAEITMAARIRIHPMLWRRLGTMRYL